MENYKLQDLIGVGSFGQVYRATEKASDKTVALKKIAKFGRTSKEIQNFRREYKIQSDLSHPNIIQILNSFETDNEIIIVTECAHSDLHKLLIKEHSISEERSRLLTHQLVSALYYLHSHRILHRDLKPQNILLDRDERVKLCDFGLARNMTMGTHVLTSIKGTPLYMAPELLSEEPIPYYDYRADLWSLGCIIYETMAGQTPFSANSVTLLAKSIRNEYVRWHTFMTDNCISFLKGLLERKPSNRTAWPEILQHPFVYGHVYIINETLPSSPFTHPLSESQCLAKERQLHNLTNMASRLMSAPPKLPAAGAFPSNKQPVPSELISSRDSVNAILQSDIENLETDIEDTASTYAETNQPPYPYPPSNKDDQPPTAAADDNLCFVSGNSNLIITNFNDNFQIPATADATARTRLWHSRNKELEKRKLSQNLENFSVRLGGCSKQQQRPTAAAACVKSSSSSLVVPSQRAAETKTTSVNKDNSPKQSVNNVGTSKCAAAAGSQSQEQSQSCAETTSSSKDKVAPSLRPGWDSCDEHQNPPIENEEWLAFLHRSMQEVVEGEMDSLKQQNLVSIIVAPLRNSKASPKVIECVAQLLSLPMAIEASAKDMQLIQSVYIQVKLVPNLVYASKLLCTTRDARPEQNSPSPTTTTIKEATTTKPRPSYKHANQLTMVERQTLLSLYELVCHLVHLNDQFLTQFCDAVDIVGASELLANLMVIVSEDGISIRLTNCLLALLCFALREQPENATVIEKVMFHSNVSLVALLTHRNDMLKTRMCRMLRMLGRFSCCALQKVWTPAMNHALEALLSDSIEQIRCETQRVVAEFKHLSFYKEIGSPM